MSCQLGIEHLLQISQLPTPSPALNGRSFKNAAESSLICGCALCVLAPYPPQRNPAQYKVERRCGGDRSTNRRRAGEKGHQTPKLKVHRGQGMITRKAGLKPNHPSE